LRPFSLSVVVRFAPSPTGYLHIGGARTALFNWLYAKHTGGKFLLRIEDTDRERSTDQAIDAIIKSLKWLKLDWDGDIVFQSKRAHRHREVAEQLVSAGKAYYCYCSVEEVEEMRRTALKQSLPPRYNGRCRDRKEIPQNIPPVIRFKATQSGKTKIKDIVQGEIEIDNSQLDDMVLLRADGTPTYMLSVVVDDHDMGITHIIRGDDHLTNMFRQYHLYAAIGWDVPKFAHIPLIHGPDGAKLSKRHGALGAEQYELMGFLPEAMRNYLLRLGWAHGNDETISTDQAIQWFDVAAVGRSPARFDITKLTNLNGHYIRQKENAELLKAMLPFLERLCGGTPISEEKLGLILKCMDGLKERAKTLLELAENSIFLVKRPVFNKEEVVNFLDEAKLSFQQAITFLDDAISLMEHPEFFENAEVRLREFCKEKEIKLGAFILPLRIAITGKSISQSLFEILEAIEQTESMKRILEYRKFLETKSS
jgi:glutamyl-tRNA synthetase